MKRTESMTHLVSMLAVLSCVQAPPIPAAPVRETKSAKYRQMTEELFIETREDPRFASLTEEQIRTEIAAMLEREGFA